VHFPISSSQVTTTESSSVTVSGSNTITIVAGC
jgi:hypothetical protein